MCCAECSCSASSISETAQIDEMLAAIARERGWWVARLRSAQGDGSQLYCAFSGAIGGGVVYVWIFSTGMADTAPQITYGNIHRREGAWTSRTVVAESPTSTSPDLAWPPSKSASDVRAAGRPGSVQSPPRRETSLHRPGRSGLEIS